MHARCRWPCNIDILLAHPSCEALALLKELVPVRVHCEVPTSQNCSPVPVLVSIDFAIKKERLTID